MRGSLSLVMLALCCCTRHTPPAVQAADKQDWFRLTLGATDEQPADWSGSIDAGNGQFAGLETIRFDRDDQEKFNTWKCATRFATMPDPKEWFVGALHIVPSEMPERKPVLAQNALYFGVRGAGQVRIRTVQGQATIAPADITYGTPSKLLNGRIEVERIPEATPLTENDSMEDDYPAITVDGQGAGWVAWTAYRNEKETLQVSRPDGSARQTIAEGEFFRPALAAGAGGRFWLAVSVHEGNTWKIAVARFENGRWGKLENVSEGGPDLFPRMAVDSNSRVWVVWQGFREGRSRIFARSNQDGRWDAAIAVSNNGRNAWMPSIASDAKGGVHFAWDSYDGGVYNVYYRPLGGGQRHIAPSARFQANASVACDREGGVWIAWDESGPNWGKDTGFLIKKNAGARLYESRQLRLVNLTKNLEAQLPAGHYEQAQLAIDPKGNVCALVRRRETKLHAVYSPSLKRDRRQQYSLWDYAVIVAGAERPISLRSSLGRNDLRAGIAATPAGVAISWAGDGRQFAKPYPFVKNNVYAAFLDLASAWKPVMKPMTPKTEPATRIHPDEDRQIAFLQSQRIPWQGRQLRILRGDMHRHTDISFDGDIDGSVWDFYRYTMDAAGFEYSALTDHNAGDDFEYFWWIEQKSADLFHYPQRFTPLYAYERSLRFPNGHRNVVWSRRGVRTLVRTPEEEAGKQGAARLYEYLRKTGGLAMSHTSGTLMGTDWRDNNKELEPLVEIYQGDRMSYEYEGGPRASKAADEFSKPGGYQPEGYVWNAWAKGYKLGVQASSDHASTHISYAVLLAEDRSREAILEAIRARHAYAATDNILLDVRSGEHIQGDIFPSKTRPRIQIRIAGTTPIDVVEVIKNNQFVFKSQPGKNAVKLAYEDTAATAGESYYYVRLIQKDGQIAWSSPMWITYQP
ncbi:MAG: hypothetical protein HY235_06230 [Acidobacteria bacterium]|nr:hypothetical protein [Acidobacteriota bacterium]